MPHVLGPLQKHSSDDPYHIIDNRDIKGGYQIVETVIQRDSIIDAVRIEGLKVYVLENDSEYQLKGGIANINWIKTGTAGGGTGDLTYVHNQIIASDTWLVEHNLDKYPSITIFDSAETMVFGDARYIDSNNIELTFSSPFAGKVYVN